MVKKSELPPCPIAVTIRLVGSKWKLFILRELILSGPTRFGALLRACPGISKKVLAESLRTLEADGLLTRTVLPGKPAPVEYALSALGRGLLPLFDAMAAWGEAYRRAAE